jgi:hypothetical protein
MSPREIAPIFRGVCASPNIYGEEAILGVNDDSTIYRANIPEA